MLTTQEATENRRHREDHAEDFRHLNEQGWDKPSVGSSDGKDLFGLTHQFIGENQATVEEQGAQQGLRPALEEVSREGWQHLIGLSIMYIM